MKKKKRSNKRSGRRFEGILDTKMNWKKEEEAAEEKGKKI